MDEDDLVRRLRPMQLIAVALPVGAVVFLSVAVLVVANQGVGPAPGRPLWLTWAAVGMVALQAVLASVFPAFQRGSAVRRVAAGTWQPPPGSPPEAFNADIAKLLAIRQTELLIGLAQLEGAAFLGCVAYLVEGEPTALVATGVAVALMLARFPSKQRVLAWLERQSEWLAELRQGGAGSAGQ